MISGIFIPLIFSSIGPSKKKSCHPRVFSKMASSSDNFVGFRPWNIWYSDFFRIPAFSKERSNISGGKNPQKRMFVQLPESTKTTKSMVEKIQVEWTNRELFSGFFGEKNVKFLFEKKNWQIPELRVVAFDFFYQRNRFWSWFVDLPNNPNTCIQNNPSDRFKLTKTPKISPDKINDGSCYYVDIHPSKYLTTLCLSSRFFCCYQVLFGAQKRPRLKLGGFPSRK